MYLAIAAGMSKGARKVHVFSASALTGAMIVLSAAFSLVIPFAVLSLVVQLFGDSLIVIGAFLLFLGPVVILSHSASYTEISSENTTKTKRVDLVATLMRIIGYILIIVWALLSTKRAIEEIEKLAGISDDEKEEIKDGIKDLLDPFSVLEKVVQTIGNYMYQSVFWTDIFMHVSRNDDTKKKRLATDLLH